MYQIGPFQYSFKKDGKRIYCENEITINHGELVIITGPSGSGKSTLLQILKGIIPEYKSGEFSGSVLYKEKSLSGEAFKRNLKDILFLFQNPFSQLLYQNASEEFLFSMENFQFTREEMERKKAELEDYFNLSNIWDKKTANLSHGECQRLVLASLLAVGPEVLLLDEPTAFLDPLARKEFYEWLAKIKGSKTIVLVDHHVGEVRPYADKVISVSESGAIAITDHASSVEVEHFEWPLIETKKENLRLRLSHVYFQHPGQNSLLRDINLQATSGDIVVVKGKNGLGKSTLFKLIAGILKPVEGEIELVCDGAVISPKKMQNKVGYVFQGPETHFFYDTIKEELAHLTKEEIQFITNEFLKNIDIGRSPFLLSEGEKRRLSLLMTVYLKKNILFYDEPTFGQDKKSINMIRSMILNQKQQGRIQFIISHDDHFIESLVPVVYELADQALQRK